MTSATESSLAKAHLVTKENDNSKQITAMKCGKSSINGETLPFLAVLQEAETRGYM